MKAGELCTRRTITADPGESVVDAARRMTKEDVGDLIVVEDIGGKVHPVGIVTDRDLVTGALSLGDTRTLSLDVRDVMQADLITAFEDEPIEAVLAKLKRRHVRRDPDRRSRGGAAGRPDAR